MTRETAAGRLLFVHDGFAELGGGERMLLRVAGLARGMGLGVELDLLWDERAAALSAEARGGFERVVGRALPGSLDLRRPWQSLAAARRLEADWAGRGLSGILAFSLRSALRAAPAARRLGLPLAWMCQQSFPLFAPPLVGLKSWLGLRLLREAGCRVICISNEQRRELARVGFPAEALSLIRNGIDRERYAASRRAFSREEERMRYGLMDRELVVACVGRIDPIKDPQRPIEALARLRERRPELRVGLLMVGGESPHAPGLRASLEARARALGVADALRWTGEVEDVRPALAAADVLLLASRKEAQGLVLAEGAAAGLALVGSRVGGIPELIEDGETGMLFESGDAEGLASALERLAAEPGLRRRLVLAAGRRVAEEYDGARQDGRWRAFLTRWLGLQPTGVRHERIEVSAHRGGGRARAVARGDGRAARAAAPVLR